MLIKEHDSVALSRSLPEHGLQIGDVGAVVFVHRNSEVGTKIPSQGVCFTGLMLAETGG